MATLKIEISQDEKKCCFCQSYGKGFYKMQIPDTEQYICQKCMLNKIIRDKS